MLLLVLLKNDLMYQLKRQQLVKTDMATCWDFFSSPGNLQKITPKYLGFDVLTEVPEKMYEGLMIEYRVRPLLGIPMNWITEITHVKEHHFFLKSINSGNLIADSIFLIDLNFIPFHLIIINTNEFQYHP